MGQFNHRSPLSNPFKRNGFTQSYFWPRPEGEGVSHYGSKMESVLGTAPAFLQGATVTEASDTSLSLVSKKVQGKMSKD